jgi:hypothetical protein
MSLGMGAERNFLARFYGHILAIAIILIVKLAYWLCWVLFLSVCCFSGLVCVAMWSVLWLNTILIRLTYEKLGIRPLLIDN